jgi:hypothetical protein
MGRTHAESGVRFPAEARVLPLFHSFLTRRWGPLSHLYMGFRGRFARKKRGLDVKLTTHLPTLRLHGYVPPFPHVFMTSCWIKHNEMISHNALRHAQWHGESAHTHAQTYIQSVPWGKVNILRGHSIGHSKQKIVYIHLSYSERFPR